MESSVCGTKEGELAGRLSLALEGSNQDADRTGNAGRGIHKRAELGNSHKGKAETRLIR